MSDPVYPAVAGLRDSLAAHHTPTLNALKPAVASLASGPNAAKSASAVQQAEATAIEFEAAMLTSFVEPMLPSEDSLVWGGTGSSAWRGLFAQEVAAELARAGGIGLADMIRPSLLEQASEQASPFKNGDA